MIRGHRNRLSLFRIFWISVAVITGSLTAEAKRKNDIRPDRVPGQFVVWLKQARNQFNEAELASRLGGKIISQVRPDMVVIQRSVIEDDKQIVSQLSKLKEIRIVEPNYLFYADGGSITPNDPDFPKLWGLSNTGAPDSDGKNGVAGVDINASKAWNITTGNPDTVVAVIDTGVNYRHPDLANNMWVNEPEAKGQTGVDDDGNGYVDDIHGYNFVANSGDPMDDNGHGTHCAGTIGAEGNNGIGVTGVNWNTSIMAIKFLDRNGSGSLDNAIKALDYARKSQATILSNSWGGRINSDLLKQAVGATLEAGQLFVAAAGNDSADNDSGQGSVPASYSFENIVSVAALNNRGELAFFSNYGKKSVHVAAPGHNIWSTSTGSSYANLSGTSMATPHVSGVAALLLSNEPKMTYKEIKDRLMNTSRPLASLTGRVVTGGLVDAYYALTDQKAPPDPNDPTSWKTRVEQQISTPHPYVNEYTESWTIQVPGAKRMAVHFAKFETESGYDKLQFILPNGQTLAAISGNQTDRFGPIIDGDSVTLKFTSDRSITGYGFDLDFVAVEY